MTWESLSNVETELGRLDAAIEVVSQSVHVDLNSRPAKWRQKIGALFREDRDRVWMDIAGTLKEGRFDHKWTTHLRSLNDAREFCAIVEELDGKLTKSDLKDLVSGSERSTEDRMSRPRDRQFELFVAATLTRGGTEVELGEPDIVADFGGVRVGVAVKRLRSRKNVRKQFAKASHQIEISGMPGVIVVDVSRLIDSGDTAFTHERHSSRTSDKIRGFVNGPILAIARSATSTDVKSVIARVAVPIMSKQQQMGTFESWRGHPLNGDETEFDIGRKFSDFIQSGAA